MVPKNITFEGKNCAIYLIMIKQFLKKYLHKTAILN